MLVQNRDGRLFVGDIDTGLPFQTGWISSETYTRLFLATGGDRAFLGFAQPDKRAIRHCLCGAFFVHVRSRQYRRLKCADCTKTAEASRRRRALGRRSQKRAEMRQWRRCQQCGEPIEAKRSTRRFCSDLCRVRAHRR
jgi:hypothetical protein